MVLLSGCYLGCMAASRKNLCVECSPKLDLPSSCPGHYCSGPIKGVRFKTFPFHAEMKQSSCLHRDSVSPWARLSCSHSKNPEVWLSSNALSPSSMSLSTQASRSGIDDETEMLGQFSAACTILLDHRGFREGATL